MSLLWAVPLLLLLGAPQAVVAGAGVEVHGGKVTIRAQGVSLGGILEEIGRQSGARVLYQGEAPNPPVTVAIEDQPLAEALAELFGAAGVDYAFQSARASETGPTIIVVGRDGSATPAAPAMPTASGEGSEEPGVPVPPGEPVDQDLAAPRAAERGSTERGSTAGMQPPPPGMFPGSASPVVSPPMPVPPAPGTEASTPAPGEPPSGMHPDSPTPEGVGPEPRVGSGEAVPGMHFEVPPPGAQGPQPHQTTTTPPPAPPTPPRE